MKRKTWKRFAAAALAAVMVIPIGIGGSAAPAGGIYIDGSTAVGGGNSLTGPIGTGQFTQYVSGEAPVAIKNNEIVVKTTKMAWWKSFFNPLTPNKFSMSGNGVLKLELKYRHEAEKPESASQVRTNTMLRVVADGTQTFIQDPVKDAEPVSEYRTDTYYIDAVSGTAICAVNGVYQKTVNVPGVQTGDITEIRFYIITKSTNSSDTDGESALPTNVTWFIDHFSIQPMEYADAEAVGLEDGTNTVSVNQEFTLKFEVPMVASTVNSDTVLLEAETADGFETVDAEIITAGDEVSSCVIRPSEPLNYTTNYRLSLADGIQSSKMALSGKPGVVASFRTEARDLTEAIVYQGETPVRLTVNGDAVADLQAGSVVCHVDLTSTEAKQARVITALYEKSKNGGMRYVSANEKIQAVSGNTSVVCDAVTVPEGEQYVLRVMIWDEAGYPWTDAVECTLGQEPTFVK